MNTISQKIKDSLKIFSGEDQCYDKRLLDTFHPDLHISESVLHWSPVTLHVAGLGIVILVNTVQVRYQPE